MPPPSTTRASSASVLGTGSPAKVRRKRRSHPASASRSVPGPSNSSCWTTRTRFMGRGSLARGPAARHPDAGSANERLPMGYNATPGGLMASLGKNFRLPEDVRPTRYRADLAPDLGQGRFDGRMDIELSLGRPRKEIVLHAIDLDLGRVEARTSGKTIAADRIDADPESQTVTLRFAEEIPKGSAVLDVAWQGKFSPGLRGLYRAGPVAVTQFEAADARRVFPCFDEPAFKARWAITVSRVPLEAAAISNGAVEKDEASGADRTVRFTETP